MDWPSFILDLANNHQASLARGIEIIRRHAEIVHRHGVSAAIKFQFRDLNRHTHGDEAYRAKFLGCQLSDSDFDRLHAEAKAQGLLTAATAFDPASAAKLQGYDYAKIASCSAFDWETITAAAQHHLPMIFSTGGLGLAEVDELVSFAEGFEHFALMHCVSLYPTPDDRCDLARIATLKRIYPSLAIGWSTHEHPDATTPIQMAVAYGAELFERHIGLGGENAYTSSPEQLDRWIASYKHALAVAGLADRDRSDERAALARVERKDQGHAGAGQDRRRGGLDG